MSLVQKQVERPFLGENVTLMEKGPIAVLRWLPEQLCLSDAVQCQRVEDAANRYIQSREGCESVADFALEYKYSNPEDRSDLLVPHVVITLAFRKLVEGETPNHQRVHLAIIKGQAGQEADGEDRLVETALNEKLEEWRNAEGGTYRPKGLSYQRDVGAVLDFGEWGLRVAVGVIGSIDPDSSESSSTGIFRVRSRYSEGTTAYQQDQLAEGLQEVLKSQYPNENMVAHNYTFGWVPYGIDGTPTPRSVVVGYCELNSDYNSSWFRVGRNIALPGQGGNIVDPGLEAFFQSWHRETIGMVRTSMGFTRQWVAPQYVDGEPAERHILSGLYRPELYAGEAAAFREGLRDKVGRLVVPELRPGESLLSHFEYFANAIGAEVKEGEVIERLKYYRDYANYNRDGSNTSCFYYYLQTRRQESLEKLVAIRTTDLNTPTTRQEDVVEESDLRVMQRNVEAIQSSDLSVVFGLNWMTADEGDLRIAKDRRIRQIGQAYEAGCISDDEAQALYRRLDKALEFS